MSDEALLPAGAVLGGAFRVVRPLARGGMGVVYVAERLADGAPCALKVLRARAGRDPDGAARRRFEREARVADRVRSEFVARVLAAGVDEASGSPWIASELLSGENLGAVVDRVGALTPAEVLVITEQLCAALGAAHAAGVVHRDVKPENVMLAPAPPAPPEPPEPPALPAPFVLKLLDFGIARGPDGSARLPAAAPRSSEDTTAPPPTTSAVGSPLWMAPELVNLLPADAGTDLWSLGLLVFWALTGKPYWWAASATPVRFDALLGEKLFGELEPASRRAARLGAGPRWPAALDGWFARCVSRERSVRYPSAPEAFAALRAALAPAVAGSAVRALVSAGPAPQALPVAPDAVPGRAPARPRRRRREIVGAGAGGALVLALGVALGARGARRAAGPPSVAPAPSAPPSFAAEGVAVPFAPSAVEAPAPARPGRPAPPALPAARPRSGAPDAPRRTSAPAATGTTVATAGFAARDGGNAADSGHHPYVPRVFPPAEVSAQWEPQLHEIQRGCWREALARNGDHPPEAYHLLVVLEIDGSVSRVTVEDMADAALANCLRLRIAAHRFPPQPWGVRYGSTTGFPMP